MKIKLFFKKLSINKAHVHLIICHFSVFLSSSSAIVCYFPFSIVFFIIRYLSCAHVLRHKPVPIHDAAKGSYVE